MKKILLVEDEAHISTPLKNYMESEGFSIDIASSLNQGIELLSTNIYSLIILDWNLPDGQGIDVLNSPHATNTPVIILSSRNELLDKVIGLEKGAVDYMTKPFEPRELIARVRAQIRKMDKSSTLSSPPVVKMNEIEINLTSRHAKWKNQSLELTKKEFDLLKLFLENPDKVFSRDELLNLVWGYNEYPSTRTIDNHILHLRQLTKEDFFETVRGIGYRFKKVS